MKMKPNILSKARDKKLCKDICLRFLSMVWTSYENETKQTQQKIMNTIPFFLEDKKLCRAMLETGND